MKVVLMLIIFFRFAFKNNTSDTRLSPAIDIVTRLLENDRINTVNVFDEYVESQQISE